MSCENARDLMQAYLDGELDLVRAVEFESHISECDACSRAYAGQQALRAAITEGSLYFKAPLHLRRRVTSALATAAGPRKPVIQPSRRWLAAAASVALVAVAAGVILLAVDRTPSSLLAQEVISGHVRSLMEPNHLTDVLSSDRHTVKPWFNGRLDFSPTVVDLTNQGFPLIGGRLDYLDRRPVAAVVYGRGKHFINLFVWPDGGDSTRPQNLARQGYNLVHWSSSGMRYWAVSDLNPGELAEFVKLVRDLSPTPSN